MQVSLPNSSPGFPHSYPFLTGDTLRAFADAAFERVSVDAVGGIYHSDQWRVTSKQR